MLLFGGLIVAVYVRLGAVDAEDALIERHGFYKAALATVFCLASFYLFDLYDFVVMHDRRELVLRLMQALGLAWIALALLFYALAAADDRPRRFADRAAAGAAADGRLAPLNSLAAGPSRTWRTDSDRWFRCVRGRNRARNAEPAGRRLSHRRFCRQRSGAARQEPDKPAVIGLTSELAALVKRENIDRIVVAMGERRGQFPTQELLQLSLSGDVTIEEGASFYERVTGRVLLDMIRPSWLIFSSRGRQARINESSASWCTASSLWLARFCRCRSRILTAILIKLESRGPVLYKQERVGKNGRPFTVMKFRSMRTDAEKDGPVWASNGDDRTTRVGRIIRKIRIDEIPQFWNILRGDMNFVGPRPERPHFVSQLAEEIPLLRTTSPDRAGPDRLGADQISVRRVD